MKYYIFRFSENSGFMFKRTKCNDYWSKDFSICWKYSKQGAENIVNRMNSRRKNNIYEYGIVEVDKVEEMLEAEERRIDYETYMAECMNERPYWWI